MWHATCDIITNTHFWAYTWKQKLLRNVTCTCHICDMWHNYKYSLLSIDMKTKIVQHVPTINISISHVGQKLQDGKKVICVSLFVSVTVSVFVTETVSVTCLCWSLAHAEQLLFSCVSSKVSICNYVTCCMSHFACHMSHCACHMSYVKCLCWFLGHAEQLLFWCLCSKVSICNYVTCHMLHVTCRMSHVTCLMSNAYVDPWDMLNNFCFHL